MAKAIGKLVVRAPDLQTGVCQTCRAEFPVVRASGRTGTFCPKCRTNDITVEDRAWEPGGVEYRSR